MAKIDKTKGKETYKENKKRGYKWSLLPLQVVLVLLPLFLRLYLGNSGYSAYPWHSAEDAYADIFLYGKAMLFMILAGVMVLLAVYKTVKLDKNSRKNALKTFIPLFLYFGFVIISTICSENITYSLSGSMDAFEPFGVLAGYVIVAFYAYLVIDGLEDLSGLCAAAVIGGFLMALIGVLQVMGKDPLLTKFAQTLFAGKDFIEQNGMFQLTFPVGQAYGTLYNPNYGGTYVAMYAPLLLIGFIMYKQLWKKAICGLTVVGLLVMLFGSQSRTGLISVIVVAVVMMVFLARSIWKYWYLVIPGITFVIMSFSLLDTYRDNLLSNRLKQMFAIEATHLPVSGVDTTGSGVRVLYKDTEYTVLMPVSAVDFNYVVLEGGEQRAVTFNEDKSQAYFVLSNGDELAIETAVFENNYAFGLDINGRKFYFTNQLVAGNYKYINDMGRLDECIIPKNVLPGYEKVASGRGYVWGRSLPLLASNFVVGSGPDTFGIEFPQNDYVARYKSGYDNIIFTRPHNFYLQMGVQTGTLSLVSFLVFYAIYFFGSVRRYFFRKFTGMEEWIGFALFLSTVGFMASGIANDSLIVVTPVFYVLLGTGMVVNHKLCSIEKKAKKKEEKGLE